MINIKGSKLCKRRSNREWCEVDIKPFDKFLIIPHQRTLNIMIHKEILIAREMHCIIWQTWLFQMTIRIWKRSLLHTLIRNVWLLVWWCLWDKSLNLIFLILICTFLLKWKKVTGQCFGFRPCQLITWLCIFFFSLKPLVRSGTNIIIQAL